MGRKNTKARPTATIVSSSQLNNNNMLPKIKLFSFVKDQSSDSSTVPNEQKDFIPLLKSLSWTNFEKQKDLVPTYSSWNDLKTIDSDSLSSSFSGAFSVTSFENYDKASMSLVTTLEPKVRERQQYVDDVLTKVPTCFVTTKKYLGYDDPTKVESNPSVSIASEDDDRSCGSDKMLLELDWLNVIQNERILNSSTSNKLQRKSHVRNVGEIRKIILSRIERQHVLDEEQYNNMGKSVTVKNDDGISMYSERGFDGDIDTSESESNNNDNCHYGQIDINYDEEEDVIEYCTTFPKLPALVYLKSSIDDDIKHIDSVIDDLYTDVENSIDDVDEICGNPTKRVGRGSISTKSESASNRCITKTNSKNINKTTISDSTISDKNNRNKFNRKTNKIPSSSIAETPMFSSIAVAPKKLSPECTRTWYPNRNPTSSNPHAPIQWERRSRLHI